MGFEPTIPASERAKTVFINFSRREIFGFYVIDSLAIELDSQHKGSDVYYTYVATFAVK
jgi:hypothetical protein